MTRYADPHRCPDCAAPLEAGPVACPGCGLPLRGETAQRLYATLLTADGLLAQLRAAQAAGAPLVEGVPSAGGVPSAEERAQRASRGPAAPTQTAQPTGLRLGARSVPALLLGLGAACVLVAGLVFLAVAWPAMGVGGRTATLVAVTVAAGAAAALLARHGLRAGAESLTLVALGLFGLDLAGAEDAGWLGDLSGESFLLLLGLALVAAGAAATLGVRRTRATDLVGAQLVAGAGAGLAALGTALQPAPGLSAGLVLGVLVAGAAAAAGHALRMPWARGAAAVATGGLWLGLLGNGVFRVSEDATLAAVWGELEGWPLLAAAVLAGAPAALAGLPGWARVTFAGTGVATAVLLVVYPVLDETPTAVALTAALVVLAASIPAWLLGRPWRAVGTVTAAAGALVAGLLLAVQATVAVERLADVAAAEWTGDAAGRLTALRPGIADDLAAGWVLPVLALSLVVAVASLPRVLPADLVGALRGPDREQLAALGAVAAAVGSVAALALYPVPVWLLVAAPLVAAAVLVARWAALQGGAPAEPVDRPVLLVAAAPLLLGAVALSLYADLLTALTLTAVLLLAGTALARAASPVPAATSGVVAGLAAGGATWSWGAVAGLAESPLAVVTLALLGAVTVLAHVLPGEAWRRPGADVEDPALAGLGTGAALAALPAALGGTLAATAGTAATWAAVYLTVAGVAVVALGLVRPDRRAALPVGGLLLAAASWVRLWDLGVRDPEPYTLPGAAVLAAFALWRLHRERTRTTTGPLSPALGLALVPTLLWSLAEPPGLRALLLGLACLALVLAGAGLRWSAPLLWGTGIGGVLVVRLAAPYVETATPTWVLVGAAGALLIALGVTWEQRLRDARAVLGLVRRLR